jgi:hypothetical protein
MPEKMKHVPVATTLNEDQVAIIDRAAKEVGVTRSTFLRELLLFVLGNPEALKEFMEEREDLAPDWTI